MKQCLACKEEIKETALKCKYCHQIQTKVANLQNNPVMNYLITVMLGIFILWITYYIISTLIEEPLEPSFEITTSNLHLSETHKGLNVRCIAKIKNPSLKRRSGFSLQAVFKNSDEKIIDVLYSKPRVTIYPLFYFEGIVSGLGSASKNEYQSCELSVVNANNY